MPRKAEKKPGEWVQPQVKVEFPPVAELPVAVYANFAAATITQNEVFVTFGQYTPPTDEAEVAGLGSPPRISARPVARIAIPHGLLAPLIDVLSGQRQALGLLDESGDPKAGK